MRAPTAWQPLSIARESALLPFGRQVFVEILVPTDGSPPPDLPRVLEGRVDGGVDLVAAVVVLGGACQRRVRFACRRSDRDRRSVAEDSGHHGEGSGVRLKPFLDK